MSGNKNLDQKLDRAIAEIRDSELNPRQEQSAADEAWARISREIAELPSQEQEAAPSRIRDCADFQSLMPAYLNGALRDAKALLLEDHVGECLPCRKALKEARANRRAVRTTAPAPKSTGWATKVAYRVAAAAVIFLALVGLHLNTDLFTIEAGGLILIEKIEGEAFRVTEDGNVPLKAGEPVVFDDVTGIRTAKDSTAMIRLADGSRVELNERAELAVKERHALWSRNNDSVIELNRGNIIVEASDQGSGHLFVDTDDCRVAVTGTVFSVNHGIKGSRISVIEGEVAVAHGRRNEVLLPGDQSTTNADLSRVPVEQEIAWSDNFEQHIQLLQEFARVSHEIAQEVEGPGMRYSTSLLDLAPERTAIYIGIPNVSDAVSQAYDLLQQKVSDNEVLTQWWDDNVVDSGVDQELERLMNRIRDYGDHLGEEIAVTVQASPGGELEEPVVLARLTHPGDFRAFVESDLETIDSEHRPTITILEGELPRDLVADGNDHLVLWIRDGLLAVSPGLEGIRNFAPVLAPGGRSSFAAGDFYPQLATVYREGVEWVVGVDMRALLENSSDSESETLERLGLMDLQHVIAERKTRNAHVENRVVLTFDQPRQGLASWLAEPGPMGAMDFIAPDASIAAGFVMEEPISVVDQLFGFLQAEDSEFQQRLDEFEREHGIDIRRDVAGALGGEFAFSLEKPLLPKPAWKLVMEVYDPAQLQQTLAWAVERLNDVAAEADHEGFVLHERRTGRRTYYQLESLDAGLSAHYLFEDGYLVASASRPLLDRALRIRESGVNLPNSAQFLGLLPEDGQVNFSAVIFQNLSSLLGPLSHALSSAASNFNEEQRSMIEQLGSNTLPSLTVAYGEEQRILFVNRSEGGLFGSGLGSLLRLDGLLGMQQLLGEAAQEESWTRPEQDADDVRQPRETTTEG